MTPATALNRPQHAPEPGEDPRGRRAADALAKEGTPWHALLLGAASNSPYLATLIERHSQWLRAVADADPRDTLADLLAAAGARGDASRAGLMTRLREIKARLALLVALADLGGLWSLRDVTHALSDLADACVGSALVHLLNAAIARGKLPPEAADAARSGYAVLAMGKHGARELNYSSDIDLICLFDPDRLPGFAPADLQQAFVRLTRDLVQVLSERTRDGYVFRTDLRLRPDPSAMPVAISIHSAEHYYESLGRTWERMAYIKARPCAGDIAVGEAFLETIRPFVWRRHLDFATLADVRALKTRINSHFGHGEIAISGHDLKRGRGGIREVEFHAQTQQIIAGGRDPALRERETERALHVLAEAGWTMPETRDRLVASYRDLRALEHRLQMIDDMQTQTLPTEPADLDRVARLAGHADREALGRHLRPILTTVAGEFDALFASLPRDEAASVAEPQDGTPPERLARLGFSRPDDGARILETWARGRYPALRGERARATLQALVPDLLDALCAHADADRALARLDAAFARLPSGLQLFAMLAARPRLLDLLAEIAGLDAPLAEHLTRNPDVLGAALEPDFWDALPSADDHQRDLLALAAGANFEAVLDRVRTYRADAHFRVSVHVLRGLIDAREAGVAFSALAEGCLAALLPASLAEVERRHGHLEGGGLAVIAMGRLGAREMTAASDLDLIFVAPDDAAAHADGPRQTPRARWAAALGQTLVTALTAPTGKGRLYDVDMRLRPSGKSGPLVTTRGAFASYHRETAQTWETLALARARVVAGTDDFLQVMAETLAEVRALPRDPVATATETRAMRDRLLRDRGPRGPWDVKLIDGGLFDIEFSVQALQAVGDAAGPVGTREALLAQRNTGSLPPDDADALLAALDAYAALLQTAAVAAPGLAGPEGLTPRVESVVARALSCRDADDVTALLARHVATVREVLRPTERTPWPFLVGRGSVTSSR